MLKEEFVPKEPDTPPELDIDDIMDFMRNGWTLKSLEFNAEEIKQLLKNKGIRELHNKLKRRPRGGYKQGRKRKNKTQRRKTKRQMTKRQMTKRQMKKRQTKRQMKKRQTKRQMTKRRTSR